jgi:hypothetical protein
MEAEKFEMNKELVILERDLKRKIAFEEFKKKGYLEKWEKKNEFIPTNFIAKTPLRKNQDAIGMKKSHYQMICDLNLPVIIAIRKNETLKEHNFYVFNPKTDISFLSGYTDIFQFINFRITRTELLDTVDEFLEKQNGQSQI